MEIVVLNSDIARLVLDYLKSQKLKKATRTFCKTSPYLKQEFSAYKQGLQTHSFFPELEEIICEYVKISRKVEQLLPKLTDTRRSELQQCNLSEKVNKLLEQLATQTLFGAHVDTSNNDQNCGVSLQSSKSTEEKDAKSIKRKRNLRSSSSSNEESGTNKRNKAISQLEHHSKKRREHRPYCFLSSKSSQRYKRCYDLKLSTTSSDKEDMEESLTSNENDYENDLDNIECCDGKIAFGDEKPNNESTPQTKISKKDELVTPILPEISQAILDNSEFQQKLVENINQALNHSSGTRSSNILERVFENENQNQSLVNTPALGEEISSNQLLDKMIKNILDATEKEPSFDAIIQEVLDASNKPQVQTTAVQCNIDITSLPVLTNPPLYTTANIPPLVPATPVTQIQQFPTQISSATAIQGSTRHLLNIPTTSTPPPRAPVILRSAAGPAVSNNPVSGGSILSAEDSSSILASNSFGQIIDPNFSISKLIVLNSNDSAPKQATENCLGNASSDHIINQLSTSGVADPSEEQVYFDTTSGQLTFPIFITNDGLLTNLPLLINNDLLNQQLQTNNAGNLEIPLSDPIVVTTNQFSANSIIISSAQKENVVENPVTGEKNLKVAEKNQCNTVPPASLNERLLHDKATPSSNGIVNTKAFRSLSTPRKRTSHVRTLTFSPRNPISIKNARTPLTSRKDAISRFASSLPKTIPEKNQDKTSENESEQTHDKTNEKAVIKTVEILPTIATASDAILTENNNISINDTGNIPPLFVSEESSNQTIISKNFPILKQVAKAKNSVGVSVEVDITPKRKQYRKAAVRSCKRQISKASNEIRSPEEKPEKENKKTTESHNDLEQPAIPKDMMEEWLRLRNSNVDLDVRLREINASTQSQQTKKINTKKRVRRKKPAAIKKKEKELVKKAEELENSKESSHEVQDKYLSYMQICEETNNGEEINSHNEINSNNIKHIECSNQPVATEGNNENAKNEQEKTPVENSTNNQEVGKQAGSNIYKFEDPSTSCQDSASKEVIPQNINEMLEREKRSKNMAFLLETPFKDPNFSSCNPPTPGIFAPSLKTPACKLKNPNDEMQASTSFLFGSLTKSELDTPLLSAITPGFRFTPFGIKEMGTPKSAPGTDYSSGGGSYYKPDESEDLDRNMDKMLRNSMQKKTEEPHAIGSLDQEEKEEIWEHPQDNEANQIEIEIPVEKLKVEPIVLKRIKSFGAEVTDYIETAKIDPHYTLVSGLPEISAAEEESSSSSSSSSSGSSSPSKSSSSSSPTSSSSSSSSSSSNASPNYKTNIEVALNSKKDNSINDLDNLSDISSTEDEEWQKLAVTDNDENSQLVSNDGEVRYPVRSWLTPVKEGITFESKTIVQTEFSQTQTTAKPATIKVTLPLKTVEKRNRQVKELELKKERLKEKLKIDACTITKKDKLTTTATTPPNISAALAASRMMHAMRDKGKKTSTHFEDTAAIEIPEAAIEKRSLEVLTALNLSAKKQLPKTPESPQKTPRLLLTDDNNQKKSVESLPNKPNAKPKINITTITPNKTPQRKCLPIEARPVTRTIRKTGKKIVRTPLAFKVIHSPGKINSHSTTTTLAELAASKTVNKSTKTTGAVFQQTLRVSPRLLKPSSLRAQKKPESPTPKSKVTKRSSKKPAAAKPKATKSHNLRKKTETRKSSLDEQIENILDDWKEESPNKNNDEEFECESEQTSAVPCKPKINLKARNAMISTKQKKKVESKKAEKEILAKEKSGLQTIVEEISEDTYIHIDNMPIPPITATTSKEVLHCVDSDDDPLEECQMKTIDETDTTSFIKCVYNGPECPPENEPLPHDFSNFHMVVAIDEYEKHIWHISDGICLFSSAPVPTNTATVVPKKRKIRTTTVTTMISENASATKSITTSNTKQQAVKSFASSTPAATSTPVINQTSSSRMFAENTKIKNSAEEVRSRGKVSTKQPQQQQPIETLNKCSVRDANNENQKIKIEDIESILSHLHGT